MRINVSELQKAIAALLVNAGASREESEAVSQILAEADMKGIATHGTYFLPLLIERIHNGLVCVPTPMTVIKDEGAVIHMDGGNGLGQYAAEIAMRKAIEKAADYGIGAVLLKNTNHIGLLAHFSLLAAERGMIGLVMCNSAPAMAPWGGIEALFGTNPFSIAAPGGSGYPITLDMATSQVARGKIRKAARIGDAIPRNWALDANGVPTTDPAKALEGTLLPIGGPKGYGMALFVDLICGLVSGASYSTNVTSFHKLIGPTGIGVASIAIDIGRFMPMESFVPLVEEYMRRIKDSPRADSVDEIFLPGEIEALRMDEAMRNGVEIDEDVLGTINKLLRDAELDYRLEN